MSKQLRLDVAQLTDVGRKRPHNEDNMAYVIPKDPQVMMKKGALFIVADGMGGHAAGEVASEIAVDTVSYAYYQEDGDDIAASLVHAIKRANTLIHQRAAENMLRSGMGTTCVAGVLRGGVAYIANVGDSRTYLVRRGQVRQVSQDHSWVAEQVRAGLLTEEQARSHAQRNVITRCLGTQADVEVDIFAEPLEEGDSFVLCSDGLSGFVTDDDLRAIVNQYVPQESVYHLVERANENGGPDNITAIVVHVQEVGWEPAPVRLNGYINGRDITTQTTFADGQMMSGDVQNGSGQYPSGPLQVATGPLDPSETITAPQPAINARRGSYGRLLYPSLVLFILLIVILVGSGIYYFQRLNSPANFETSYANAQNLISLSKQDIVQNNPTVALQHLSKAQAILHTLQGTTLTDAQNRQVNGLLSGDFTSSAKLAISNYNTQSLIMSLSCPNQVTTAVNNGSTNTLASSVASIENSNGSKTFYYTLGDDGIIYLLSSQQSAGKSLQNPYTLPGNPRVLTIASDGTRLAALTSTGSSTSATTTPTYTVVSATPDDAGVLKPTNSSITIGGDDTKNGFVPKLLTAQGNDVYVVLASGTSLTSAKILHYTIDGKSGKFQQAKASQTISISNTIESIAAFPNQQLFLLTKDGNVQSLMFTGGTQAPTLVTVQPALAAPLAFSSSTFTASTPVAVPTPTVKQSTVLQVPSAKLLVASTINNVSHLYIVDDTTYHRVIDLQIAKSSITATATAAATATSAAGSSMTMRLIQQYASPNLFVNVKGIAVDPKSTILYLIVQNEQNAATRNFITVNTSTLATCAA